ncbi:MAG: DNA polymerase III subunit beta [Symbiobacterium sp.]|uniref:DNA polymerase III subunit beta n=1 Tax=Symbiobacterium sp. TaxID=1971213 RepID=UPI0034643B7F
MKILISQEGLNTALTTVARAVSTKNTIPVLSGIYLSARDGELTIRATDLELAIEAFTPCEVITEGEIVLPARYFADLIRRIPYGNIELSVDYQNYVATLRWGRSQYVIHGFSADQFPSIPDVEGASAFTVSQNLLRDLLRQTTFAAGHDESKPWLTGVLFKLRDNTLTGTATDGIRIAHAETTADNAGGHSFSVIIPSRSLNELTRLLTGDDEAQVNIAVTANQVFFDLGKVRVISRLLEGQYPDVMRLVPQVYPTQVTLPRADFMEALERATLITKDGAVKIGIQPDKVTITANTPEVGQVYEELSVESMTGDPLDIGFNARFLLEFLKVLEESEFRFQCSGSRNPARLQPAGSNQFLYVVLPLITL